MAGEDQDLQIRIQTSADLGGIGEAEEALQGFATSTKDLAGEMRTATRSTYEFGQIMRGLERGGMGGAMEAVRGLRGLLRTLGPEMVGAAGVMAPAIALVSIAVVEMNRRTAENKKAMADMWAGGEERAKEYKAAIESIDKAAEKMTSDFLQGLAEINDRMKEMEAGMAEAGTRFDTLREAGTERATAEMERDKAKELAVAATPEQKAEIEDKYAGKASALKLGGEANKVINEALNAPGTISAYTGKIGQIEETRRAASVAADQARLDAENAKAVALAEPKESGRKAELLKNATELLYRAQVLAADSAKISERADKDIAEAEKKIAAAKLAQEAAPDRARTVLAKAETASIEEDVKARERMGGLKGQAAGAGSRAAKIESELAAMSEARQRRPGLTSPQEFAREDQLKEQLARTREEQDQANNMLADFAAETARAHRKTKKTLDDATRQLRAIVEKGG